MRPLWWNDELGADGEGPAGHRATASKARLGTRASSACRAGALRVASAAAVARPLRVCIDRGGGEVRLGFREVRSGLRDLALNSSPGLMMSSLSCRAARGSSADFRTLGSQSAKSGVRISLVHAIPPLRIEKSSNLGRTIVVTLSLSETEAQPPIRRPTGTTSTAAPSPLAHRLAAHAVAAVKLPGLAGPNGRTQVGERTLLRMSNEATDLASKMCLPCRGGIPPLTADERKPLLAKLDGWSVVKEHHLSKEYAFSNFVNALAFVNSVGDEAEANDHHPDIYLTWGKVRVDVWTHKINGLTEADFVLAAKCDRAFNGLLRR